MGKVLLEMSVALDGYVAIPDISPETPMGRNGERLHEWMFAGRSSAESQQFETDLQGVTDGIDNALQRAQEAAGSQDVLVNGGADIARQFLNAELLDEVRLHLVPVVLGAGTRLFDGVRSDVRLRARSATTSALVTPVTYEVKRQAAGDI